MNDNNNFWTIKRRKNVQRVLRNRELRQVPYQGVIAQLEKWAERFDEGFELDLQSFAIRIEHLGDARCSQLRCFKAFRLGNEITIDRRHIEWLRSPYERWRVLGTLLKEMLGVWQEEYGTRPPDRNYYNNEFKKKARSFGLLVDDVGAVRYLANSRFSELLRQYGVWVPDCQKTEERRPREHHSEYRIWVRGCDSVVKVRRSVPRSSAKCLVCNCEFQANDTKDFVAL